MNVKWLFISCLSFVVSASVANAQQSAQQSLPQSGTKPREAVETRNIGLSCDSTSFLFFAQQAEELRVKSRLSARDFAKFSKEPNTIVLDARSKEAHNLLRIKGSINLPYTSMAEANLSKVIPTKSTRILIYCRNNIVSAPPRNQNGAAAKPEGARHPYPSEMENQFEATGKAASIGLNIPTYITLFIYGYKNVWELDPAVDPNDSPLEFESGKTPS